MTRFRPKDYVVPTSSQEAVKVLEEHGSKARILAGGTTFYELSERGMIPEVEVIVDLSELKLDSVKFEGESLCIGSMVRLTDLLKTPAARELALQAIEDFLVKFTPPQIRNMATVGGEVCAGVPFLDFPGIAIALGASFKIVGPKGPRTVAAGNFFLDYFLVDLRRGEYLQEITIPIRRGTATASAFMSLKRTSSDLSLVNVAVSLTLDRAGSCGDIAIGLGGMGPIPLRGASIEAALSGKEIDSGTIERAVSGIDQLSPVASVHASPWYKKEVCKILVRDTIERARDRSITRGVAAR